MGGGGGEERLSSFWGSNRASTEAGGEGHGVQRAAPSPAWRRRCPHCCPKDRSFQVDEGQVTGKRVPGTEGRMDKGPEGGEYVPLGTGELGKKGLWVRVEN